MKRVARRLAAILVADVAGYSRLVGIDEEGTISRLRVLRRELIDPALAEHGGRLVKTMGDGLLVEFPSVVEAVRAAVELQRGMTTRNTDLPADQRIELRVGIHLGDVMVEGDDLLGDGVNVAARLEGIAEPGGICLSEDAYRQVRDRLMEALVDLGDQTLKNISRPVRAYAVKLDSERSPTAPRAATLGRPDPPRLSLVVLPFMNIGDDPEQEYFADGVTESLTTDLSRVPGSFVIARNTAFTYKGKPFDVKQIGREIGVRYVLEGSVQRLGERLRVNVQLIAAESGHHLWAERFDKPVADLFDMQDEIVARLANTLDAQLVVAEAHRAERAPHPDSMDLYFQGMACLNKGPALESLTQAHGFFERAMSLDPGNTEALVGQAIINSYVGPGFMMDDRAAQLAAAEAALAKVLAVIPHHALARTWMGFVHIATNRAAQGIAECEQALALNPNLALAHGHIGGAKYCIGRGAETEPHIREALRLSPRDPLVHVWLLFAGVAKQQIGADEEAVFWYHRAIEANRNYSVTHFWLAAALAIVGRLDEARAEARSGLALDRTFTVARFRAGAYSDNPIYLRQRERISEGMRQAGVPEG